MSRWYLALVVVWLAVVGLTVYFGMWAYTAIDVRKLERSAAIVRTSSPTATHVLDARSEHDVKIHLGGLEPGERISLERWDGRIVSVVGANGRRMKTTDWPGGEDDRAYSPALGWSVILGVVWLVWTIVLVVRRLRRPLPG